MYKNEILFNNLYKNIYPMLTNAQHAHLLPTVSAPCGKWVHCTLDHIE